MKAAHDLTCASRSNARCNCAQGKARRTTKRARGYLKRQSKSGPIERHNLPTTGPTFTPYLWKTGAFFLQVYDD